jgi:hypothetical protein
MIEKRNMLTRLLSREVGVLRELIGVLVGDVPPRGAST